MDPDVFDPDRVTHLLALVDWAQPSTELAMHLETIAPELILHPRIATAEPWLDRMLAAASDDTPYLQLLLWELSVHVMGHAEVGTDLLERAEGTFLARSDRRGLGLAKALIGTRQLVRNEVELVGPTLEESRRLLGSESPHLEALLANMSWTPYIQGNLDVANLLAEQAVSQARVRGNSFGEGTAWFHVGFFAVWRGDFPGAQLAFRNSVRSLGTSESVFETPMAHAGLGTVSAARGDFADASEHFARAYALADTHPGFSPWLSSAIGAIWAEHHARYQPEQALSVAQSAQRTLIEQGDEWWARWALRSAARALDACGLQEAARLCLEELLVTETHVLERAHAARLLGDLLLEVDPTRADALLRESLAIFSTAGANLHAVGATVALLHSRPRDARQLRKTALDRTQRDRAFERVWQGDTVLDVRVLGSTEAFVDGKRIHFPTVQAEEAFYALAVEPRLSMNVETLAALVWPDARPDRISQRINTLVWQLRSCLGRAGERIQRHRSLISLNLDEHECDLRRHLGMGPAPSQSSARARSGAASLSAEARAELSRPVLPRFAASEWVIELQHHIHASL